MSLAEIKDAVTGLSSEELAELTAFILERDGTDIAEKTTCPGTVLEHLQALEMLQKHLQIDAGKAAEWMQAVREARR